jgi:hypothetical protein
VSAKVIPLFEYARVNTNVHDRKLFEAAINLARARNALRACGHCERIIKQTTMVFHVPEYRLFFCVPCGVVWRDEIYPLLKGRDQ